MLMKTFIVNCSHIQSKILIIPNSEIFTTYDVRMCEDGNKKTEQA